MNMLRRRKRVGKYTVGLSNRANDCFANSNLQALASLRELYAYLCQFEFLIPNGDTGKINSETDSEKKPVEKVLIPQGRLSKALGQMIRDLNEPVLSPKTLSPWKWLVVLEQIYKSRISRSQHDAHELLHLILETLQMENDSLKKYTLDSKSTIDTDLPTYIPDFPFHGSTIDRITCSKCNYSPPVKPSSFLVLSLMVPQKRSATLNDLLDELATPEFIKDYGCSSCRLQYLLSSPSTSTELRHELEKYVENPSELPDTLEQALPKQITSPIAKCISIHKLPQILSIHLSRSIYGGYGASRNSCKVSVPEILYVYEDSQIDASDDDDDTPVKFSSSLNRRRVSYRLIAMIRHKGTHHTGHYECFRQKNLEWWNTNLYNGADEEIKNKMTGSDVLSKTSVEQLIKDSSSSTIPSPSLPSQTSASSTTSAASNTDESTTNSSVSNTNEDLTKSLVAELPSSSPSSEDVASQKLPFPSVKSSASISVSLHSTPPSISHTRPQFRHAYSTVPGEYPRKDDDFSQTRMSLDSSIFPSRRQTTSADVLPASTYEWWKVSDDKVWEVGIKDVLKEESGVYLLFYERVK
jgi:ubiquitin carboxyl-terminal hydrolase 16